MDKPIWGILLEGDEYDLDDWVDALSSPFDPWVEKHGSNYVLRSKEFDGFEASDVVNARAVSLVDQLNGLMAATHNSRTVRVDSVGEMGPEGIIRHHALAAGIVLEVRCRARLDVVHLGPDGMPIPPQPQPSIGQRWISLALAEADSNLSDLLAYHSRGANWFDMYKAVECMERRFGGEKEVAEATGFSRSRVNLLTWTANVARHRRGKFKEPPKPMDRSEAYEMIGQMIQATFRGLEEDRDSSAPAP